MPVAVPSPTPQNVVVSQQFVDDATKAFEEVIRLRDAVARLKMVNDLAIGSERKAVDAAFAAMDVLAQINNKIIASYVQLDEVRVKTITAQAVIIERLLKQLNKGQSTWAKIWQTVEKILAVAVGVLIGKGL